MTSSVDAEAPALDALLERPPAPEQRDVGRVDMARELGLDGLRGLAVAAVVAFHLGRLQGGFLGVDLFFVLSGFLITSLLLREATSHGSVGLGAFWARRARRLLPALLLALVGVSVLLLWLTPEAVRAGFRGEMLATLGYVANWERVVADASYWDIFNQPSPLDHMWSLAIEEQFYVLWPLVLVGLCRVAGRARLTRAVAAVSVVAGAVSLVWLAASYDPLDTNWAYFSTFTRLGPTLLGAALAAVTITVPRRLGPPGAAWDVAALGALAAMTWLAVDLGGTGAGYYRGGLVVFAVAAVVAVRAVTGGPPGLVARALSVPPLRALGLVSYGVYLWHWPVIVYATEDRTGLDGWALDLLCIALTLTLATLSYVLVERPVRRGVVRGRRLLVAGAVASVITLGAGVVATQGTPLADGPSGIPNGPLAGTDTIFLHVPASVPPGATRLLLVGDSGAQYLGPELVDVAGESGVSVAFSSEVDCTPVNPEGVTLQPDGSIVRREPCHDHRRALWTKLVREFDPDLVVFYLANAGGIGEARLDGEWVLDCDPPYDRYIERALTSEIDLLAAGGAPVVLTTTPYMAVLDGRSGPRTDCRNETLHEIAAARPGTQVVDLNRFVTSQTDTGVAMRVDSTHLSPEGGQLVSQWLLPLVLP
ncbi:MAG TPA: acyltransferase family protein [Acidimicrobiales bacterium]|nr:acyltransferase family protein [Acidimicrobiales bacterium]